MDPQKELEVRAQQYFCTQYPVNKVWDMFSKECPFREYAFFVKTPTNSTVVIRHLHFVTVADFVAAIKHHQPVRIEVGGVHLTDACTIDMLLEREIVFDIDINAYSKTLVAPAARSCACQDSKFCRSCWHLMAVATDIITSRAVAQGIPTESIVIHYSGGRGLHIRFMTDRVAWNSATRVVREAARRSIIGNVSRLDNVGAIGELLTHNTDLCQVVFDKLLSSACPLSFCFGWYLVEHAVTLVDVLRNVMAVVGPELASFVSSKQQSSLMAGERTIISQISQLQQLLGRTPDLARVTSALLSYVTTVLSTPRMPYDNTSAIPWHLTPNAVLAITAFICLWPRVDKGPTDQPTHLLRAPFGIHLSSGRTGVPVPLTTLYTFYPL
jgi:hypothetical protein